MKTSEFRKWLKDNDEWFIEDDRKFIGVNWAMHKFSDKCSFSHNSPKEFLLTLIEYKFTPLEEREEDKKYYLEFSNQFLYESILENAYQFSSSMKQAFKQSQIDNLPLDFTEAIECGFLKKVEVK